MEKTGVSQAKLIKHMTFQVNLMLMSCSFMALYHVFTASLARFIGPEGEFKVNISVSDPDRLFFTDKVRNSVFWR
ncbi:hypothetical protein [Enterobacter hormaechei]|uniref:hypothetical protein n=1 Tax=Enterobacter hormaechei TaxID=158836 RepID=UPI00204076B1|nr:hypothetical protein [Enterobacter hormaechei]HDT4235217.1 hypothetical protein [Enterobacter hormaechei subsp. steigerwaltii]BDK25473.1 hypothetical protein FJMB80063_21520 [Enterobacter hormaechei]BDK30526.1 hypothetical protein FJMB80068_20900 [Enterobacter hormaechei]BDK35612.1 hypothetical protein FJMB80144_21230 [Enterobacter hormaechei]BDK40811.1 hypothetical protein FJMB80145_21240 [Enterobacter hormaechei]